MKTLAERLRRALQDSGLKKAELADRTGLSRSAISQLTKGESKTMEAENLVRAAEVLGVDPGWLATGRGSPGRSDGPAVVVPIFDVTASMGGGALQPEQDAVVGGLRLTESWVSRHLPAISSPKNLAVISAIGDSMAPTFSDGDILLVDRGVNELKVDAVYFLAKRDELFIKRIQRASAAASSSRATTPCTNPKTCPTPPA